MGREEESVVEGIIGIGGRRLRGGEAGEKEEGEAGEEEEEEEGQVAMGVREGFCKDYGRCAYE